MNDEEFETYIGDFLFDMYKITRKYDIRKFGMRWEEEESVFSLYIKRGNGDD